jgi:hypothetical protein
MQTLKGWRLANQLKIIYNGHRNHPTFVLVASPETHQPIFMFKVRLTLTGRGIEHE